MSQDIELLIQQKQYSIKQQEKEALIFKLLNQLDGLHSERCEGFRRINENIYFAHAIEGPRFLPVSLFKNHDLLSIPRDRIHKVLTSSGTSGQAVSKIYLDDETASLQVKALASIISSVVGPKRLPMLVLDSPEVLKNRESFSARGAGILGLMNFGRDYHYGLNPDLTLDKQAIKSFVEKYRGQPKLIFGFTFLVWSALLNQNEGLQFDLSESVLIHSGGWKKLEEKKISNAEFKTQLSELHKISRVFNFYGMVEQIGSVFLEGTDGLLYPPNFADIIIRDPLSFKILPMGEMGVVQIVSVLPKSYPGHSILTEDFGVIEYVDRGIDGRFGKAFRIIGRIPQAELRGCSDVIAASRGGA